MRLMTSEHGPFPWRQFLAPRYWHIWVVLALFRALVLLPYGIQIRLGSLIGRVTGVFMRKRRRIATTNLALCFPTMDEAARKKLLGDHFAALGIGLVEAANCWWASDERLRRMVRMDGLEHLERARASGRPIILLSAHFTTLEIGGRLLGLFTPFHLMYRPSSNPLLEEVIRRNREAHFEKAIPHDSVKDMMRSLKDGIPVWYAPDQNYRRKHSVLAPFFNIPVATNTATSRIARSSGAIVIPFLVKRLRGSAGYQLTLSPPLEHFPSEDAVEDAATMNLIFETAIREAPEQYLWIHRRFKPLPGQTDPYK